MARRSGPPSSGPAFVPHPSQQRRAALYGSAEPENESAFSQFIRTQITAPDKVQGNLSILISTAMFVGGIAAVRTWGELMIPA